MLSIKPLLLLLYKLYALLVTFLFLFIVIIPFSYLILICFSKYEHRKHYALYYYFKYTFRLLLILVGIRMRISYQDKQNLTSYKRPKIYIANHLSYLDSFLILNIIRHFFRPLGKYEIKRIPIIGYLYGQYVISVNRNNILNSANSILQMSKLLYKGTSLLIFPEGGFKDKITTRLHPFKNGAFKLAIKHKLMIHPIIFLYTYERLHFYKNFYVSPGKVEAIFLKPIDASAYQLNQVNTLKDKAYEAMYEALSSKSYPYLH